MLEIGQEWVLYTTPFRLKEVAAAPTGGEIIPDVVSLYAKDNGSGVSTLCYKTDAGTEICLPTTSSGSFITGTGTTGRLAKFTGTGTIGDFAPTAGSVIFAGASGIGQEDNANFFWDNANHRLGIGTATPGVFLDVLVTATADGGIKLRSASSTALAISVVNSVSTTRLFNAGGTDDFITGSVAGDGGVRVGDSQKLLFGKSTLAYLFLDSNANIVPGTAGLATTATTGFFFIESCAGTPTGTVSPTFSNRVPICYDRTNDKLYAYNSTWKDLTGSAGAGMSIGGTVTSGTTGSVLFVKSGPVLGQDNADLFWDTSLKYLGIGTATPATILDVNSLDYAGAAGTGCVRIIGKDNKERFDLITFGSGNAPGFQGVGAGGTIASPSATSADQFLSFFGGSGYDNAGTPARVISNKGLISVKAGEAWTTTANGTYITFETTPLLSTTRAERFRIGPSGQWGIGGATFGTSGHAMISGGASVAPSWDTAGITTTITTSSLVGKTITVTAGLITGFA